MDLGIDMSAIERDVFKMYKDGKSYEDIQNTFSAQIGVHPMIKLLVALAFNKVREGKSPYQESTN